MEKNILKQLLWLKIYVIASTLGFAAYLFMTFNRTDTTQRFKEIEVERINVVEKDGRLRLVISNEENQHPGVVDGKVVPARKRPAGLIFFNDEGDECGGLCYNGGKKEAGLVLSVDQYKNDQVMQLQYDEVLQDQQRLRSYGLKLWDRPENFTLGQLMKQIDSLKKLNNESLYQKSIADMEAKGLLGQERLFVGKNRQAETGVFIRDEAGNARIKLYVDKQGDATFELLDASGKKVPLR
ncbi:hypothetical protein ACFSUS_20190 [Spirosoma soli]|uniref:Uncharacterized protein n=1 Tax=Spirosoma soli TaxID=1770529 RepID=A0ABW5M8D7_9BACT